MNQHLRILVSREEDMLVAQCLEHDIAVQAPDIETLQRRFDATIEMEANAGTIDAIPPAPAHFHVLWDSAAAMTEHFHNAEMRLAA